MSLPLASIAVYVALSGATILMNGFMSLTYFTSKALQVHPQGLLQCISILEVISGYHTILWAIKLDSLQGIHMIANAFRVLSGQSIDQHEAFTMLCGANQLILTMSITGIICYNTALCLDLAISLWRPIFSVSKRLVIYHSLTALGVTYFTVYIDAIDSYITVCHPSRENSIQIINSGAIAILLFVYIAVAPLSILYASIRIYKSSGLFSKKKRNWLVRYIIYTACFTQAWAWAVISYLFSDSGLTNDSLNFICIVMVSSSGCVLALIRASEPIFCKELYHYMRTWSMRELNEDNMPLSSQIQSEQRQELFHIILSSLCHAWSNIELEGSLAQDYSRSRVHNIEDSMSYSIEVWGQHVEASPEVILNEYSPAVFSQIKENAHVFNSDLHNAFSPFRNTEGIKKASEGDGRSGSFIMKSSNNRFLLKTVSAKELKYFTSYMLPDYHAHLKAYPQSMICKIYGAFKLDCPGMEVINVIVMENIMMSPLLKLYDLKGSTVNRKARRSSRIGKDLDFLDMIESSNCVMEADRREGFLRQLAVDAHLLRNLKVMDYSLLFGISKEPVGVHVIPSACGQLYFHFGVIDFLIHYDKLKNLETIFKTLQRPHKCRLISAVNSKQYAHRFIHFMLRAFSPTFQNYSFVSLN